MESMKNVFRFVVGSLAVAGVLALIRGWSKVPDYLLMIVGMAIVWLQASCLGSGYGSGAARGSHEIDPGDAPPNKSLDRSAGSLFLNLIV